ncbi:MAG: efflux RND transporter periplasmic adaptor subunit [Yoonia sp.]|uniref:efflux RND transporter periplasmic adaptor subunit n=1 Tax=Yoonia sp. TaxID=2212373 RepID=UPI00273DC72C|nr:efflux RND transporter periplasmic adaptor subunit [Yoonia sp.]MDP5085594.1 efflux RND transporter periplasmic adaptor subunit [Yoonia sp.]
MTAVQQASQKGSATEAESRQPASEPPLPALRHAQPDSKPKRRLWLWGATGVGVIALSALAYTQFWMAGPLPVAVEVAALAPVTRVLAVNGRIAAVDSVEIRPVVTGRLITLAVDEGDVVTVDQVLARVDAEAQNTIVRQALAGLDAALIGQQQAQEVYDRALSLGPNITRTELESNAHAVEIAAQDVAIQTAALDQARVALANYTVRAPIAGTVLVLDAEVGQLTGPTTALMTLADLTDLVVEADVDEAYATQIARNQPAVLQLAGETVKRDGHVGFVSARVDAATGGLAVKIAFDAPVTAPIGLTVATNIIVEQRAAALTIPRTALQTDAGETGIFVLKDGSAVFQPVTVVDWPAARLIVSSGLSEGDMVIADANGIIAGQAVAADQP